MGEAKLRGSFDDRRAMALASIGLREERLVVYATDEPDAGEWCPVMPADVPDVLRDKDMMGRMVAGEIAQIEGNPLWYRAERANG